MYPVFRLENDRKDNRKIAKKQENIPKKCEKCQKLYENFRFCHEKCPKVYQKCTEVLRKGWYKYTKRATPSAQRGWLGVKQIEVMRTPEPIMRMKKRPCAVLIDVFLPQSCLLELRICIALSCIGS